MYATVPLDNYRNKLRSSEAVTDKLRLWSVVSTKRYSVTVCKHEQELYVLDDMLIVKFMLYIDLPLIDMLTWSMSSLCICIDR